MAYEDNDRELLEETFGKKGLLEGIRKENEPELLLQVQPNVLERHLEEIADIIEELPDEEEMAHLLEKAGCTASVYDIGLKEEIIPLSLRLSPYVRRRLSFMRVRKMLDIKGE